MDVIYGKPIDVIQLKKPVLSDLQSHLQKVRDMVDYLRQHETPVKQPVCYICGSSESKSFGSIYDFEYVTCQTCGHVYTNERYSNEAITNFYIQDRDYTETTYANKETYQYRRENVAGPKVQFLERYSQPDGSGSIWLDIGCGIGDLVSVAREHGWQADGIEVNPISIQFASEVFNIDLIPEFFEDYAQVHPELTGKVSVISYIGVLEHLVNPMAHLELVYQMLKPGGVILCEVPNAHSIAAMIQVLFPNQVFRHMLPTSHIQAFTKQSLLTALEKSNLEPLAMWFLGLDVYELINNLILVNQNVQDSEFHSMMIENLNPLQQVFDKKEISDTIICVAKKQA